MAAIAPGCAWRGPLVDAAEAGFGAGARQAAAFYYGGIAAAAPPSALNQTRMSAMLLACPWRGPLVNPADAGFTQGNRQAAAFMYSAILAGGAAAAVAGTAYMDPIWAARFGRATWISGGMTFSAIAPKLPLTHGPEAVRLTAKP